MKMALKVERRLDYDNQYSIDINLTENPNKEDYATINGAIGLIESVLNPYIDKFKNKTQLAGTIKGGKNGK